MKWSMPMLVVLVAAAWGHAAIAAEPASAESTVVPVANEKTAPTPAPSRDRAAPDRLDLDTTVVTGNRELPKVLYIVPWKKAEAGDLPEQPFNSLLDEALTPIDRDEFRREVSYFSRLVERTAPVEPAKPDTAIAEPPVR
jgi:hypothetical protein